MRSINAAIIICSVFASVWGLPNQSQKLVSTKLQDIIIEAQRLSNAFAQKASSYENAIVEMSLPHNISAMLAALGYQERLDKIYTEVAFKESDVHHMTQELQRARHALQTISLTTGTETKFRLNEEAARYAELRAYDLGNTSAMLSMLGSKIVQADAELATALYDLRMLLGDRVAFELSFALNSSAEAVSESRTELGNEEAEILELQAQLNANVRRDQLSLVELYTNASLLRRGERESQALSDYVNRSILIEAAGKLGAQQVYRRAYVDVERLGGLVRGDDAQLAVDLTQHDSLTKQAPSSAHVRRDAGLSALDEQPFKTNFAEDDPNETAGNVSNDLFEPCHYCLQLGNRQGDESLLSPSFEIQQKSNSISLSMWLRIQPAACEQPQTLIAIDTPVLENDVFALVLDSSEALSIRIGSRSFGSAAFQPPVCDNAWHNVVVVWSSEGGEMTVYVDGKFRSRHWGMAPSHSIATGSSATVGNSVKHAAENTRFGAFHGALSHVFIIFGEILPIEITPIFREDTYRGEAAFVHWSLDQRNGSTVKDAGSLGIKANVRGGEWIVMASRNDQKLHLPGIKLPMLDLTCDHPTGSLAASRCIGSRGLPIHSSEDQSFKASDRQFGYNPFATP